MPDWLSAEGEVYQNSHQGFFSPTSEAYISSPDNNSDKKEGDLWLKIFWKTY